MTEYAIEKDAWTSEIHPETSEGTTPKPPEKPIAPKKLPTQGPSTTPKRIPNKLRYINSFETVFKFLSVLCPSKGEDYETHCIIRDGWVTATDSIVTVGHPIDIGVNFNPKFDVLQNLLSKFPDNFSIVVEESSALFTCGTFTSHIPCTGLPTFRDMFAASLWGAVDNSIMRGLTLATELIAPKAEYISQTCVELKSGMMTSTNGNAVFQYWHGHTLPVPVLLPKQAIKALIKCKKELSGVGYAADLKSCTFYFSDKSWLKTQLFTEAYPSVDNIFVQLDDPIAIPPTLFQDIKLLNDLAEHDYIFCFEGSLGNYPNDQGGAHVQYPIFEGVTSNLLYKSLSLGEGDHYKTMKATNDVWFFQGDLARLAVGSVPISEIKI